MTRIPNCAAAVAIAILAAVLSVPRVAGADGDLAPFVILDADPLGADPLKVHEVNNGLPALRDGSTRTIWRPGSAKASLWFELPRSDPRARFIPVRVVITPDSGTSVGAVTAAAGMDRAALRPLALARAGDAARVELNFSGEAAARVLQLTFDASGSPLAVAEARLEGRGLVAGMPTAPNVRLTCESAGVRLQWQPGGTAHRLRVERTSGDVTLPLYETTRGSFLDGTVRFRADRPFRYRLTPIGWDGAAGETLAREVDCRALGAPLDARIPSGVVEGFYGVPWTPGDRLRVIHAMAAFGLDSYFYCPKDDPFERDRWREGYDQAGYAGFGDLLRQARAVGVDIWYGIAPGLDLKFDQIPAEAGFVLEKLRRFQELGYRSFGVLLDDLPEPPNANNGRAHADLSRRVFEGLRARDPRARMLVVPSAYYLTKETLPGPYRAYLDAMATLPSDVLVMWTGRNVFSTSYTPAEVAGLQEILKRPPMIWDNYPVNDYPDLRHLLPSPVEGRAEVIPAVAGILSNPLQDSIASITALASFGEMVREPTRYAADRAAGRPLVDRALAFELAAGTEPPDALGRFFDQIRHEPGVFPNRPGDPETQRLMTAYSGSMEPRARAEAGARLARYIAPLAVTSTELEGAIGDTVLFTQYKELALTMDAQAEMALLRLARDRLQAAGDRARVATADARMACLAGRAYDGWPQVAQRLYQPFAPRPPNVACSQSAAVLDGTPPARVPLGDMYEATFSDPVSLPEGGWEVAGPAGITVEAAGASGASGRVRWRAARVGPFAYVILRADARGVSARVVRGEVTWQEPQGGDDGAPDGGLADGGVVGGAGQDAGAGPDAPPGDAPATIGGGDIDGGADSVAAPRARGLGGGGCTCRVTPGAGQSPGARPSARTGQSSDDEPPAPAGILFALSAGLMLWRRRGPAQRRRSRP